MMIMFSMGVMNACIPWDEFPVPDYSCNKGVIYDNLPYYESKESVHSDYICAVHFQKK